MVLVFTTALYWGCNCGAELDIKKKLVLKATMADDMSIDKKEIIREGSEDSMDLNSPTPEAEPGAPPEAAGVSQQKRKGGRKPVRSYYVKSIICPSSLIGFIDLCNFRGAETAQSPSASSL